MRIAVCTNVFNETFNLSLWYKHYKSQFGEKSLFVLDHGSDFDVASFCPGANIIRLPRSAFNDVTRANSVSDFVSAMLGYFDACIYTDCDELLVADPRHHSDLLSLFKSHSEDSLTAIGLDIVHDIKCEPSFDMCSSIFDQRAYVRLNRAMFKTAFTKKAIRWGGGFHSSSSPVVIGGLFLFHLRSIDCGESLSRLSITRAMDWSGDGFGFHQRVSDESHRNSFEQFTSLPVCENFFQVVDREAQNQLCGSRYHFWSRRYVLTSTIGFNGRLRIDPLFFGKI